MNYKVLAVSVVIGVGVIAAALVETQGRMLGATPQRSSRVDDAAPETQFGFMQATSSSLPSILHAEPAPPQTAPRERVTALNIAEPPTTVSPGEIPVSLPQIAYLFSYGFRIAGADIPALQQRHADLCESKGPLVCRIVAMDQTTSAGEFTAGTLQLAVASNEARAFGKQLASIAESADGKQVESAISGEDLSKQIVDTDARLRARVLLRDRLMDVLATRRGTVTELVEAERGVATVNEEIDQARSWLGEMKNRVAFSRLEITYESAAAPTNGFMDPVRGAVGSLGSIFGVIVAMLILAAAIVGPILAAMLGVRHVARRMRPVPSA